jgi:hypothetical protein
MADSEFLQWINRLKEKHFGGSFQRLANEVGVTFSALKRSVKNGSTSIETLLRICLATGEPPDEVFAVAGKREVHELITQLYGPTATFSASARAKAVARMFDALREESAKKFFEDSLKGLAGDATPRGQNGVPSAAKTPAMTGKAKKRGTR